MSEPALDPRIVDRLRQLTLPGEPDILAEVFQLFLEHVPCRIETLRAAWKDGDAAEVHRAAHSLTGSSGNVGAKALLSVCRQLDDIGRTGDLSGMQPLVDALDVEFARVEAEMRGMLGV